MENESKAACYLVVTPSPLLQVHRPDGEREQPCRAHRAHRPRDLGAVGRPGGYLVISPSSMAPRSGRSRPARWLPSYLP
eukprot:scaffold11937_cov23-Phaeocystis_antarctica.AAC.1